MSIQQSVNQSLSILGALYTQTPMYEAKKEAAAEKRELAGLEKDYESKVGVATAQTIESGLTPDFQREIVANRKRAAEINPDLTDEYLSELQQLKRMEEGGTAKAAQSLSQSIDKNIAQKDRVADFYNSLKSNSFVQAVNETQKKINLKNLGKPSKEVKDGKSVK